MRTVVIIDDDLDDLEFFKAAIGEVDPNVACIAYTDCEKALDALHASIIKPDVIFLDINMPKITGDMCLDSIRKEAKFEGVKIAMVSTSMEHATRHKLLKAGADFALWKPYRMDGYTTLVKQVLESRGL